MAKKNFKNQLGGKKFLTVLNSPEAEQKEEKVEQQQTVEEETPKQEKKEDKIVYRPHTLKIREDVWEASQALAWWQRETFQGFFTKVLESYIEERDPQELKEILSKYSNR